jgi:hypothetical protein
MEPGQPLSAEQLREKLERTHDVDGRATLIRAVAALIRAGGTWAGKFPALRHEGARK